MAYAQVIPLTQRDLVLVERCRRNDTAAYDEIVERYKSKLYNYLYRMIGNDQDAEDLTQEVFIRMYTSLGSFRSQSSLNTWLFRIAGNLCIDRSRRNKKHQADAFSLDDPIGNDDTVQTREIGDMHYEPFHVLENSETAAQLELALRKLPEKLRHVIILHDIEGMPYEEIAQVVQCPLGTVKSRLFNARMQMRQLLAEYVQGTN